MTFFSRFSFFAFTSFPLMSIRTLCTSQSSHYVECVNHIFIYLIKSIVTLSLSLRLSPPCRLKERKGRKESHIRFDKKKKWYSLPKALFTAGQQEFLFLCVCCCLFCFCQLLFPFPCFTLYSLFFFLPCTVFRLLLLFLFFSLFVFCVSNHGLLQL